MYFCSVEKLTIKIVISKTMKITNGAIKAVKAAARETVGFPDYPQRNWDSKDKEERFVSLF